MDQILSRAQIPLCSLNRRVAEQKLDLLKLAAGSSAKLGARASQVVGCDAGNANCRGILPEHLPDDLLAQAFACYAARAVHRAEYVTINDSSARRPCVNRHFHPRRHRRGPNPTVLSDEVNDAPPSVTLLDMSERERRHLRSSQPAAEEDGKNGTIAQPANRRDVGRAEESLRLALRQPVPDADASRFHALHAADPLGQLRREQ